MNNGSQTPYLDQLYQKFQQQPESVPPAWQAYFRQQNGENIDVKSVVPASVPTPPPVAPVAQSSSSAGASTGQNRVSRMIQSYRNRGHRWADINPLYPVTNQASDLSPETFDLDQGMLGRSFVTDGAVSGKDQATLEEIIHALKQTYTRGIGVQYSLLSDREQRVWLRQQMESCLNTPEYIVEDKKRILQGLIAADGFERFLHTKFVGVKRFSVEGGDVLIPMLDTMIDMAGGCGISDVVIGMAHRGRMNVLANILDKPVEEIFAAFSDTLTMSDDFSSGDVKYHHGKSYDVKTRSGHDLHISLLNNPSHLEVVNPVVMGSARAKQRSRGKDKVMPVLIHGDSAFAGQGVVPESLNLAQLEGYGVGGTIHIVINNQVGFTANPTDVFSGEYCTDIARMLQVPIFHVNGDDAEACNHVMQLAMKWRDRFHQDVVIDLVCYRRYGHNEGDDPTFTQPGMYDIIKGHPRPVEVYKKKLLETGSVPASEIKSLEEAYSTRLQKAYEKSQKKGAKISPDMFGGVWSDFEKSAEKEPKTAIGKKLLDNMSKAVVTWEKGFTVHPKIKKGMEKRSAMLAGKENLDWGAGEIAAYGSLLNEGYSVRISGQDVKRGTFSHRHVVQIDYKQPGESMPIAGMAKDGAAMEVWNSSLSELAVLGYEFGYSLAAPKTLTVWEAQFGDFANGAQIIFDQFISSSEVKWHRMSGLVMLLPHGYEGQGPEHSSARLERWLQLCAENNMIVANMTTPAQIFHALRRQMLRSYRKPLIVMSPKSLLRHPKAVSGVDDLTKGGFQEVIPDDVISPANARRVVLCSGKIYYDLLAHREENKIKNVALIRVEQLYPLPEDELQTIISSARDAEIVWVQEESRNQGAWTYMLDNLQPSLKKTLRYIGRPPSASPAVGSPSRHKEEQADIVKQVFAKK